MLIVLGYNITGEGCTLLARANGRDIDAEVPALRLPDRLLCASCIAPISWQTRSFAVLFGAIPVFRLSAADRQTAENSPENLFQQQHGRLIM